MSSNWSRRARLESQLSQFEFGALVRQEVRIMYAPFQLRQDCAEDTHCPLSPMAPFQINAFIVSR